MSSRPQLDRVRTPDNLRHFNEVELQRLCQEIRDELIDTCGRHGGHLGSNLGVVELTVALHLAFRSPDDKILFDVSHQGYVHKMLTGRRDSLRETLRQTGGCSGFLQRDESVHDAFGAGHAGTILSAAVGFAAARDRKGGKEKVVAVVGDGAFGCGITLEALNAAADTTKDLIVVLNDNKMSISPNVGSLAGYLNRLITDRRYNTFRDSLRDLVHRIPRIGDRVVAAATKLEEAAKSLVVPGVIFEELGFRYIGPIDGHDLPQLIATLRSVRELPGAPVLLHVLTEKGRGFGPANKDPERCHGFKKKEVANPESDPVSPCQKSGLAFSNSFAENLTRLAKRDSRVVAITAGMLSGTGLNAFKDKHPTRVYDVGIAEEHASIFAAGMAAGGLRPVVAIYCTFLQRAMDCVFHDVCLQELPVMFCCDRAGLVEDGPTHHGIQDLGFWIALPGLAVMAPRDTTELGLMMDLGLLLDGPSLIRYPKSDSTDLCLPRAPLEIGRSEVLIEGSDVALWTAGRDVDLALETAKLLTAKGLKVKVVNARFLKPFDAEALRADAALMPVVTIEEHVVDTGLGCIAAGVLAEMPHKGLFRRGLPAAIVTWGKPADLRRQHRLDPESLAADTLAFIARRKG
ncbi:MAG: hypothetical protein RL095_2206 [Verrucomicrobiota bacterium]|jgi:1-deoxy-D-xylulose-5-phosphate synthase